MSSSSSSDSSFFSSFLPFFSSAAGAAAAAAAGAAAPPPDGTEASFSEPKQKDVIKISNKIYLSPTLTLGDQLIDGFALEFGENLVELGAVNLDTDAAEDLADVVLRRALVTSEGSQQVSGNVTHF